METCEIDPHEIREYFSIDNRIQKARWRINSLIERFYEQTTTTRTTFNGLEIRTIPFNVENSVISFVDTIKAAEKTVERLAKKKRYLNDYLDSLDPNVKKYLVDKYSSKVITESTQQADIDLMQEIREIDEAINRMYGFPVEVQDELINNENLEDDFLKMAELLEV